MTRIRCWAWYAAAGLRVEGEHPQKIRFKHSIVATGSQPAPLPGIAAAGSGVIDSTAVLELDLVPERLLVIGGGYIGLGRTVLSAATRRE